MCPHFVLPFLASCGLSLDLVEEAIATPDYTDLSYWVAHPEKVDLSDSVYSSRPSDQFNIPVKFIGVGEGIDDLKIFNSTAFVHSFFN